MNNLLSLCYLVESAIGGLWSPTLCFTGGLRPQAPHPGLVPREYFDELVVALLFSGGCHWGGLRFPNLPALLGGFAPQALRPRLRRT